MEIERKEESTSDERGPMAEADEEGGDVGAILEEAEGHNGVDGEFPLVEKEEGDDDKAKDDEAEDGGRRPGVGDPAIFKAEEEHDRT